MYVQCSQKFRYAKLYFMCFTADSLFYRPHAGTSISDMLTMQDLFAVLSMERLAAGDPCGAHKANYNGKTYIITL